LTIGFVDSTSLECHPGWPLRNLLILAKKRWNIKNINVLSFRESLSDSKIIISKSLVFKVVLPDGEFKENEVPLAVGLEKNTNGKLGSRNVDLSAVMDPKKLAETAVDLNLKLMRWRILPELNLEKISATRCLLFGAGTLGCYVARSLMAWGIRDITFVDNGKISFSNPIRQPLYEFEDCLTNGEEVKFKANVAAEKLKKIFPATNSKGHVFTIPMPGHHVSETLQSETLKVVEEIEELIENHDVIFLLTDSRESRWLPTMISAAKKKIVINTALGFDNFLVMRHGVRLDKLTNDDQSTKTFNSTSTLSGSELGCYFCNDVVAPSDSLSDRTLDQQCTVTRPGLSALASGIAVELLMSVITHSKGPLANSSVTISPTQSLPIDSSILGLVPHQIRGYLTHFSNLLITGKSYDKCTACSPK
ncbi:Autophagy protein 7, partial [Clydaea vesicula]